MPTVPNSTLVLDNLPQGIDRADGLGGRLGIATQDLAVTTPDGGNTIDDIPLNELPDSPTIERAEQGTCTHRYSLSYEEGLTRLGIYGRGALVRDSAYNYFRVLSSSLQRMRGDHAILTVTTESVSFDNPPDEFQITPVKLGLDILKHPRYFYNLMPTNQLPAEMLDFVDADTDVQSSIKAVIIRGIQAYRENPFIPEQNVINTITGALHDMISAEMIDGIKVFPVLNPNFNRNFKATKSWPIGTAPVAPTVNGDPNPVYYYEPFDIDTDDANGNVALALAAAQEIIGKLWRCEDSPMVNGWEMTWVEYYFRPPSLNIGSYIENPILANPGLPDYFYSTEYPPDPTYTIFADIATTNPQMYSLDGTGQSGTHISWLRDADTIEYQRTWFKVTRKWLGAPIGCWDADLYNQGWRPLTPSAYRPLTMTTGA